MIDGGVIAGYLAVAAARSAGRFVDRKIDGVLDRLSERVATRLGVRPVTDIARDPRNMQVQHQVGRAIEATAATDAKFAREIARLQADLDRQHGRALINDVRAGVNIQAIGGGDAVGGNLYKTYIHGSHEHDYSGAPMWVKVLIWIGVLISLVGFGILAVTFVGIFGEAAGGGAPDPPSFDNVGLGFGVFFAGLVLQAIGAMGKATSRPRH
ncbi:MAG: hypothetical protein ACRDQW_04205 [Haloechinothrix sp.]